MAKSEIIVEIVTERKQTDLRDCSACKEPIYSVMNKCSFVINEKTYPTDIVLCNSCANAMVNRVVNEEQVG